MSASLVQEITSLSATQIAHEIRQGDLSATDVVSSFIQRICEVSADINAVSETRFDLALKEAREADLACIRDEPVGALHGVPLTIKHSFDVEGMQTSVGIPLGNASPSQQDCPVVSRLRRAGGIVLGKTNVGQLLAMSDTDNPVYGRTKNPWDLDRTPGGSSGGEAAIIACRGSAIGLGSDAGGSIRHPAHSCGVHGLKPTTGRFPMCGHTPSPNYPPSASQAGPIARHVEDLILSMNVMLADGRDWDPIVPPVQFRDPRKISLKNLRVGFYTNDGFFPASPSIRRVVEESATALENIGVSVVPFTPPDIEEAMSTYFSFFYADGFKHFKKCIGKSKPDPRMARMISQGRTHPWLKNIASKIVHWAGHARLSRSMQLVKSHTIPLNAYWELVERQRCYRRKFMEQMETQRIDAILCPPHALPAMSTDMGPYMWQTGCYCMLYNLLGMPAGVVSVSRVRPGEETDRLKTRDVIDRCAIKNERNTAGLPIGVMVAGKHWREDIVLAVMNALEEQFKPLPDYPLTPYL